MASPRAGPRFVPRQTTPNCAALSSRASRRTSHFVRCLHFDRVIGRIASCASTDSPPFGGDMTKRDGRSMSTGVLAGQMLLVLGTAAFGVWFATQWTAAALGYQARLGECWFSLLSTPLYYPWRLFQWWYFYNAYAPGIFLRGGAIAACSGFASAGAAIAAAVWRSRQSKLVTTYGSARWASDSEITKTGLSNPSGVFLGCAGSDYLRHDGPEHVMAFAPTRSGKGVGLVVPTLLSWAGSTVIHDIKGENWQLTAGWRARFSHCLLFNPTDSRSAAYNPLLEVRRGQHEVRDVQNIADILVDPEGALGAAQPLGKDEPRAPGRRHPSRPLCGG